MMLAISSASAEDDKPNARDPQRSRNASKAKLAETGLGKIASVLCQSLA